MSNYYCPTTEEFDATIESQRFINLTVVVNDSLVKAHQLNSSDLSPFCSDPVIQEFAKVVTLYTICNNNDTTPSYASTNGLAMQIFFTALFIMVGCIGLVGNILTVIVIAKFTRVSRDFICGFNYDLGQPHGHCDYVTSPDAPFRFPFEITVVITFLVPLVLIVYCYVRILAALNEMAATTVHCPIGRQNSDNSQITSVSMLYVHTRNEFPPRSQQTQKVIKMLVIVTTVFFLCYLPHHIQRLIVNYWKADCDKSNICQLFYPISGVLQYVSAMLNPILYNLMSVRFRKGFNHLTKEFFSSADREYSAIRDQNIMKLYGISKCRTEDA